MSKLTEEQLNEIDFDDENTICECGAYGVFVPPAKEEDGTIVAKFKCNNGHYFSKKYPRKDAQ